MATREISVQRFGLSSSKRFLEIIAARRQNRAARYEADQQPLEQSLEQLSVV